MERLIGLAALLTLTGAAGAADRSAAASDADARLAAIGHRLATANVSLCDRRQPRPGWMLHAVDQYLAQPIAPPRPVAEFEAPVAVALVVPSGPAARAGITADEALVAIGAQPLPAPPPGPPSSRTRDAIEALVADQPADRPLTVELLHSGVRRQVTIPASPGCRVTFEVLAGAALKASSDGRVVQLSPGFFRWTDAEVAVVVAHELSHAILHHRERLEAAGVKWGLLAEFGRNRRLFRRTEDDADRLSVALLRNAGYDPASAPAFWRAHGDAVGGGFFRARTHGSSGARAAMLDAEVAAIPPGAARPWVPPVLATRDQPLD